METGSEVGQQEEFAGLRKSNKEWTQERRQGLMRTSKEMHKILLSLESKKGLTRFNGSTQSLADKETAIRELTGIPEDVDVYDAVVDMKQLGYPFSVEGFRDYFSLNLKEPSTTAA